MAKVTYLESHNEKEDKEAADSIIFEIEKGDANKIVWFSNLNIIIKQTHFEIKQNSLIIEGLKKQIIKFEKDMQNMVTCIFTLKDSVEKLQKRQRENYYKIIEALKIEDKDGDQLED